MGAASIPVDCRNPGQVFACLGLLEAADVLCGGAQGGFAADWSWFKLVAEGSRSPVEIVIEFLVGAKVEEISPGVTFPTAEDDRMSRPICLVCDSDHLSVGHWADGSSREPFKLYAGNRTAAKIASDMLELIRRLGSQDCDALLSDPLNRLMPMSGSFNFDPRGGWTAIDAGYSPDKQGNSVLASPVVEMLAAVGLQQARPKMIGKRFWGYAVWQTSLPAALARAALAGSLPVVSCRCFQLELRLAGKNKVVTFAEEE